MRREYSWNWLCEEIQSKPKSLTIQITFNNFVLSLLLFLYLKQSIKFVKFCLLFVFYFSNAIWFCLPAPHSINEYKFVDFHSFTVILFWVFIDQTNSNSLFFSPHQHLSKFHLAILVKNHLAEPTICHRRCLFSVLLNRCMENEQNRWNDNFCCIVNWIIGNLHFLEYICVHLTRNIILRYKNGSFFFNAFKQCHSTKHSNNYVGYWVWSPTTTTSRT